MLSRQMRKPLKTQRRRTRSEEHTSELQSRLHLVCRLLLEKKKKIPTRQPHVLDYNRRLFLYQDRLTHVHQTPLGAPAYTSRTSRDATGRRPPRYATTYDM